MVKTSKTEKNAAFSELYLVFSFACLRCKGFYNLLKVLKAAAKVRSPYLCNTRFTVQGNRRPSIFPTSRLQRFYSVLKFQGIT